MRDIWRCVAVFMGCVHTQNVATRHPCQTQLSVLVWGQYPCSMCQEACRFQQPCHDVNVTRLFLWVWVCVWTVHDRPRWEVPARLQGMVTVEEDGLIRWVPIVT